MTRIARSHARARRLLRGLLPLAGLAALVGAALVGPRSAAAEGCPTSNPPNLLKLVAGSSQTAQLGRPFQANLQVALANSNGCPVTGSLAGASVRFVAPSSGASGSFASSGANVAVVGTDAMGVAVAPTFIANDSAGSYSVRAESDYGAVELSLTNTAGGVVATITVVGQTERSATVNGRYEQPLRAQVLDAGGRPVQSASVIFSLGTGVYGAGASFLGGGGQATALTNSSGQATSPPFVANGTPGRFTATASTTDIPAVAIFSLANHAATSSLSAIAPAAQTATVETRYRRPLQARVLDSSGQPIEGAPVTFTLGSAGGGAGDGAGASFLGGGTQATAASDASGRATSPPFVANAAPGRFTATATMTGATTPVSYALRNLARQLTAAIPAAQTATVERRYRRPLRARVRDAAGRPVDGVAVTFTLPTIAGGAGASFPGGASQATAITDANGRASSPPLLANSRAGRFTATATITGLDRPVRYPLRNLAGKPTAITAGAASGRSTPAGSRFPIRLAVTVKDSYDNPVTGTLVTFTAPTDGPSGRFGTRGSRTVRVKTNASGVAVAPVFTANATPGGYVVTAAVVGTQRRAAFALVNEPAGQRE